jgi:acetyl esterase/lipase
MGTFTRPFFVAGIAAALCLPALTALAQPDFPGTDVSNRPEIVKTAGIPYATVDGETLALDLYMPAHTENPPLVVYLHGGAWRFGSRDSVSVIDLVDHGFALASVSFRLTPVAPLPAQVHDIKGAIRFLRAHAADYGYDASRIGITGVSSGAHLAALVGLTNGSAAHEGEVGGNLGVSSDVQAIVSYFGASNLTSILAQSTPFGLNVREPALELLLGGSVEDNMELARFGSPVFQVDSNDPPLLLLHGDQDPQMPINQSHELQGAAEAHGLNSRFEVVHGAGHGGAAFFDEEHTAMVAKFLSDALSP